MNPFERFFSPKKDDGGGKRPPETPDIRPTVEDIPTNPETDRDHPLLPPQEIQDIIDGITREEESDAERSQIIDERKNRQSRTH